MKRITLVTTVLNDRAYLAECIKSVLGQEYPDLQYIVVDGGSTDGSRELIEEHRDAISEVVFEPDENHFDAIRKGLSRADGEVLGWLNSNDILLPDSLFMIDRIFSKLPFVHWATGSPMNLGPNGALYDASSFDVGQRLYTPTDFFSGPLYSVQQESTFFTRDLYTRSGELGTDSAASEDYRLWANFFQHEPLHLIQVPIGAFRRHAEQESGNKEELHAQMEEIRAEFVAPSISPAWRVWRAASALFPTGVTSRVHGICQAPKWKYDWESDGFKPANRRARACL